MRKRKLDIFLWIASAFMLVSALMFMPSFASILMLVFAFVAAPIAPIQRFLSSKGLTEKMRAVLLVVLFVVSAFLAPTGNGAEMEDTALSTSEEQVEIEEKTTEEIQSSSSPEVKEAEEVQPSVSLIVPEKSPEQSPEISQIPSPDTQTQTAEITITPEAIPSPEPSEENVEETPSYQYVGSTESDKYHLPSCGAVDSILPENEIWFESVEDAQAQGYYPCGRCLG